MKLLERLLSEIDYASRLTGLSPVRHPPEEVMLEEFDPTPGYRSGVLISGKKMLVSSRLDEAKLRAVIRREAFIHLIPPEAEVVPQVLDLAWAYSGASKDWWRECGSVSRLNMFQDYDPPSLLSLIPPKKRMEVIKTLLVMVRFLAMRGELDFPIFHYLLRKMTSAHFKPTPAENKVLAAVKLNPYASQKEIAQMTSLSPASVSRSINRLRRMGYLSGPMNVHLHMLGLVATITTFPNVKPLRNVFMSFPFTYRVFEPSSKDVDVHASLLIPFDALQAFRSLEDRGVMVHQIAIQKFIPNLNPPDDPIEAMLKAYEREYEERKVDFSYSRPRTKITKEDLRILNLAMQKGEVRARDLEALGVASPRYRLSKLKSAGLLDTYYTLGVPQQEDDLIVRISEDQFIRLVETIGAATTLVGAHLKGPWEGFFGVLLPKDHLRGKIVRGLRLIFRDRLEVAEDAIDYRGEWALPIHLWDEEKQRFMWGEEFEKLVHNLELMLGRSRRGSSYR